MALAAAAGWRQEPPPPGRALAAPATLPRLTSEPASRPGRRKMKPRGPKVMRARVCAPPHLPTSGARAPGTLGGRDGRAGGDPKRPHPSGPRKSPSVPRRTGFPGVPAVPAARTRTRTRTRIWPPTPTPRGARAAGSSAPRRPEVEAHPPRRGGPGPGDPGGRGGEGRGQKAIARRRTGRSPRWGWCHGV